MHDYIKSYISTFKNFSDEEKEVFIKDFTTLWKYFSSLTPEKRQILKTIKSKNTSRIQQRYWEMYLFDLLSSQGVNVKIPSDCLDFLINDTVWVEATAPEKNASCDEPALRLSSAIDAKKKQFLKHREKGVIQETDSFVIAINGSLLWSFDAEIKITKDLFLQDHNSDISGIIFSMVNPFHKTLHKINPDMYFIHNPHAKNPIAHKTFKVDKEYDVSGNELILIP